MRVVLALLLMACGQSVVEIPLPDAAVELPDEAVCGQQQDAATDGD